MNLDSRPLPANLWREIFGDDRPVEVEVGPGRGEFLLAAAAAHPERNYFAIERSHSQTRLVAARLDAAGLANARVLQGDATCILQLLPDACVSAFHVLFPDPWWKRRHHRRRFWSATAVAHLRRTLVAGGTIGLVTDVEEYFRQAKRLLDDDPGLEVPQGGAAAGRRLPEHPPEVRGRRRLTGTVGWRHPLVPPCSTDQSRGIEELSGESDERQ
jgi:tRNA (guanine-N(7)-)-methyltransferase